MSAVAPAAAPDDSLADGNVFVGIIDGTGPREDVGFFGGAKTEGASTKAYDTAMAGGFCKQLECQLSQYAKSVVYERGPANSGGGLKTAVNRIAFLAAQHPRRKIVLIGYSRGGLGCIQVCELLKKLAPGKDVDALLLLDPVDRYASLSFRNDIPRNVKRSYRAFRVLDSAIYGEYDGSMADTDSRIINHLEKANPFRPGFGRTALGFERSDRFVAANHIAKGYNCSHGGMGGVGYKWVAHDEENEGVLCTDIVNWFNDPLKARITLTPGLDPNGGKLLQSPFVRGKPRPAHGHAHIAHVKHVHIANIKYGP